VTDFALQTDQVVLFYGDSITEQQLYTVYVEAFVHTRFPDLNVRFFNRGWGGDIAGGLPELGGLAPVRVERDVKPLHPDHITVLLGMNDGGYVPPETAIEDKFRTGYEALIKLLKDAAPKANFTLMQTPPWDDYAHSHPPYSPGEWRAWQGYNDVLRQYGRFVQEEARQNGAKYVDLNQPLVALLKSAAAKDPRVAEQIIPDSIHPGPAGHLIMAGELLKAWNAPAIVSEVRLDASSRAVTAFNTTVGDFDGLAWTQLDRALPLGLDPNDESVALALRLTDFSASLNRQPLAVDGLAPGSYELLIDGEVVGSFRSDELGAGVDLAALPTPMKAQALRVLELAFQRSRLAFVIWRQIQFEQAGRSSAPRAVEAMQGLEQELYEAVRAAAKPLSRRFVLRAG
jgi:lysophospholipase L1-like esterase